MRGFGLRPVTTALPGGGACHDAVQVTWVTRSRKTTVRFSMLDPAWEKAVLAALPRNATRGLRACAPAELRGETTINSFL